MAYRRDNDYDAYDEYEDYDDMYEEDDAYETYPGDDIGHDGDIYFRNRVISRDGEPDSHYTKRDPSRKRAREQAMAQRRVAVSARSTAVRRQTSRANAGFFGSLMSSVLPGKASSSRRQQLILVTAGVVMAVVVLTTFAITSVYRSKSMFSDSPLDDNAIQERLITEEANKDKVTYFLIAGVDKSSKLTDCIWVMCFDNEAHKMNVMQIPRDTYVGRDSLSPHKINAVYANPQTVDWCDKCERAVTESETVKKVTQKTESNISALIRCINSRLSLPIDHYVLFDFKGFEQVVDALGGVDIYLEQETKVYPNKTDFEVLPAGDNHLDGKMALKFMRNRQIYIDGDLGRVKAQRSIIHAMMEKTSDMSTLQMLGILRAAYGNFSTDMSLEEIRSFIAPVKACSTDSLNMFTMPGTDHWVKPHPSYYVCDETETAAVINEYMMPYSEKLTEEDIKFPVLYD